MCRRYQSLVCWPNCIPYALNPMSDFTLCLLGKCFMFLCPVLIFFKIKFFEEFFQKYHQSVKQFGSRSGPTFVGPDLGSNCLQKYQQTTQLSGFFDISEFEKGKAFTNIKFHIYLFTQEANQLYLLVPSADNSNSAYQQKTKKHAKLFSRQTIKNMRSKYIIHSKLQVKWLQQLWDHKIFLI